MSVFLPTEQAAIADTVSGPARTMVFARYCLVGSLAGAVGALLSAVPANAASHWNVWLLAAEHWVFVFYAVCAVATGGIYVSLSPAPEVDPGSRARRPLAESRAVVLRLAALFSVDSFGGGFIVQSLLVLWLYRRFHLAPALAQAGVGIAMGTGTDVAMDSAGITLVKGDREASCARVASVAPPWRTSTRTFLRVRLQQRGHSDRGRCSPSLLRRPPLSNHGGGGNGV